MLKSLGLPSSDNRLRQQLKLQLSNHGLILTKFRSNKGYTVEQVVAAVKQSLCVSDVLTFLGLQKGGTSAATITKIINENNIDISHFDTGAARRRGKKQWTYEEVFCKNSEVPRASLRNIATRLHNFGNVCTECNIPDMWNGKPLLLQLDHKNGINKDNRIENLRLLCPNCHSQTPTFNKR